MENAGKMQFEMQIPASYFRLLGPNLEAGISPSLGEPAVVNVSAYAGLKVWSTAGFNPRPSRYPGGGTDS